MLLASMLTFISPQPPPRHSRSASSYTNSAPCHAPPLSNCEGLFTTKGSEGSSLVHTSTLFSCLLEIFLCVLTFGIKAPHRYTQSALPPRQSLCGCPPAAATPSAPQGDCCCLKRQRKTSAQPSNMPGMSSKVKGRACKQPSKIAGKPRYAPQEAGCEACQNRLLWWGRAVCISL